MIASIHGVLVARRDSSLILEVGGLGLEVQVPAQVLGSAEEVGEKIRLYTYLHVREDALALFGFGDEREREMFLKLIGISGIGPKVALNILSVSNAGELARSIHAEDTGHLLSLPGIGRKTAERIILELKDKIDISYFQEFPGSAAERMERELVAEAIAALVSIGLTRANAQKALDRISPRQLGEHYGVEDIVREALRKANE
ncbi:MAG: Holliday junction branch migration protein RuvA [Candidatus Krumholzibacteriota bacterium]|nr:Holliday junction branch migration protein RuvA [Candidatus Krumholzibacteriota bacterium]